MAQERVNQFSSKMLLSTSIEFGLMTIIIMMTKIQSCDGFQSMIGPGLWRVRAMEPCEGEFPAKIEMSRRKFNRTHDGFNVKFDYDSALDDTHAIRVDICKYVDGGCKPYQTLADDSIVHFVDKFAASNMRDFLTLAGVDPPDFPIPEGTMEAFNYVFDYSELPENCPYGSFGATTHVLRGGEDVVCFRLDADFQENDQD